MTLMKAKRPSAGIIIIGDEILKGQTQDTNTHFLATNLKARGIELKRVAVIPDDIDIIAKEVKTFSDKYEFVFTSGGVGPTHDDITFEGVAKAFDDTTFLHPEMEQLIRDYFKDVNDAVLKLGQIPTTSTLNYPSVLPPGQVRYPLVSVKNVYIFPGIPTLLQRAFNRLKDDLFKSDYQSHVQQVFVTRTEIHIADSLNQLVETYKDSVTFGSYPTWSHNYYQTKITVEAESAQLVDSVVSELKTQMPSIESFDKFPFENKMDKISTLLAESKNESFKKTVLASLEVLEKCFKDFKVEEVSIAFNGGKDNIAMMHLVHAFLQNKFPNWNGHLEALYIEEKEPFREVEEFMDGAQKNYSLELTKIERPMKTGLGTFLKERPHIKAMIMGTRKGDPGSETQGAFSLTDGDWPSVMRVNPVIDWDYEDIWTFIRGLYVPYPTLYDKGYTSLGSRSNTRPNPNLAFTDEKGMTQYKPAYELTDGKLERAGRVE